MPAIGDDAAYLKMPVPGVFAIELHESRPATDPFAGLRHLVHHVFSQQIAKPLPVALLGAVNVSAHSLSGSRCLVHGSQITRQHRWRARTGR
jgi:hypothetical protein